MVLDDSAFTDDGVLMVKESFNGVDEGKAKKQTEKRAQRAIENKKPEETKHENNKIQPKNKDKRKKKRKKVKNK